MKLKLLNTALVLIFITGCATTPRSQMPTEFASTHGYVYANLPGFDGYREITLKSLETNKRHSFIKRTDSGYAAFGLWLLPGEYQFYSFNGFRLKDYPTINVEARRLTNLGSLIAIPVGGYEKVILPISHPETKNLISNAQVEFSAYLTDSDPINWTVDETPNPTRPPREYTGLGLVADLLISYANDVNEPSLNTTLRETKNPNQFFSLALEASPPGEMDPAVDALGNLYFGGRLGQIRRRDTSGKWSSINTGTLQTVTSISIIDGRFIAGYADGSVRNTMVGEDNWALLIKLAGDEKIVGVDLANGRWLVLTSTVGPQNGNNLNVRGTVRLYSATQPDLSDIAELASYQSGKTDFLYIPSAQQFNSYYYFNPFPELVRLDLNSFEFTTITPEQAPHEYYLSREDGTLTAYRNRGIFTKVFVSPDMGASWAEVKDPPYIVHDIYFYSSKNGKAVRREVDAFSSHFQVMNYQAEVDKWELLYKAPIACSHMLRDGDQQPRFCVTTGGSILDYQNNEWEVEFAAD